MCQRLLQCHYPDTCLVDDVKKLLKQQPRGVNWNPKKLNLAKSFQCKTHSTASLGFNYVSMFCLGFFYQIHFICLPNIHAHMYIFIFMCIYIFIYLYSCVYIYISFQLLDQLISRGFHYQLTRC